MSEMYQWLENNIREYYQFVRALKKDENKEILLYKHKSTGQSIVVKMMKDIIPVYERLVSIRHSALTEVIEMASSKDKVIVIEEYVNGITIADALETELLSPDATRKICLQICDGLYALHVNGVIHRDIKPENIFILPDGSVKIADYDAARMYKNDELKDTRILGTIGYAAPEQYGEAQTDEKSDIYALGILMNVMLTGKHPSQDAAKGKIGSIIEKCIIVNPKKRYQNILEVRKQLKKLNTKQRA